jgi:hypothetical protein
MVSKVKLSCAVLGIEGREFDLPHAERLLQYQERKRKTDWQITPGSGYQFHNGVISKTSNRGSKKAEVQDTDTGGEGSRGPDQAAHEGS